MSGQAATAAGAEDRPERLDQLDRPDQLDRLDQLSAQVAELTALVRAEQEERQRWRDLAHELTPIAQGAMAVLERELDDLSADVSADDVARFLRTLTRSMPRLEVALVQLDALAELMSELTALAGSNVGRLSETLAVAEQRGYFDALRELTRPELFALARRVAGALAVPAADAVDPQRPPSSLALLRRLRNPQTRLGLARLLAVLEAMADPRAGGRPGDPGDRPAAGPAGTATSGHRPGTPGTPTTAHAIIPEV